MIITITRGAGAGSTKLAAFDSALYDAGIANFNLIRLSSVIPSGSQIFLTEGFHYQAPGAWGDRLYVVMAEHRVDTPNETAWVGIGWVIESATGNGLFVEFESDSELSLRQCITDSLEDLMKTRGVDFGEIHMALNSATCRDAPVCALVAAVYKSEPW
jgi:arginine decarboxylase